MKIIFPLLIFVLFTTSVNAQLSWQWGVRGNDYGPVNTSYHTDDLIDMTADVNGNVYALTRVYTQGDVQGVPVAGIANALNNIESIVVNSFDCNGNYRWHKVIGGTAGNNNGIAIRADALGGVYVTGRVLAYPFYPDQTLLPDSLHIDTDSMSGATNKSLFIVKYDTSGTYQWLRMPQPDTVSYVTSISKTGSIDMDVAPNGDVFVYTRLAPGSYEHGSFVITNNGFYILRYNKHGVFMNVVPLSITYTNGGNPNSGDGSYNPVNAHFKRDHKNGRFYLSGIFEGYWGTMSIGNTPLEYTGGFTQKLYVGSFDSLGHALWVRQATAEDTGTFGSASNTRSRVAIDDDGNIFIAGFAFTGDSWYGHVFENTLDSSAIFLLKMDKDGNTKWITSPSSEAGEAQKVVCANGVVGLGGVYAHLKWGDFEVRNTPGYGRDVFLARFNSSTGAVISMDTIISSLGAQEWVTGMAADKNSNFSIGGYFKNLLYVPGSNLMSSYHEDWFVAKLGTGTCVCDVPVPDFSFTTGTGNAVSLTYTGTTPVDSVVWEFGDGNIATGSNVNNTYSMPGTYTVCASVYNHCGMVIHCEVVNTDGVGIAHIPGFADIRVYPNPATQNITIEHPFEGARMEIYNTVGSIVRSIDLQIPRQTIEITDLAAGVYMMRFTDRDQRQASVRFIKR